MIKAHLENGTYTTESITGDSIGQLCRRLKEAGSADTGMEVYRGDQKVMTILSIYTAARFTVREEPHVCWAKHVPFQKWTVDEEVTA
jgi:hypothetical protein